MTEIDLQRIDCDECLPVNVRINRHRASRKFIASRYSRQLVHYNLYWDDLQFRLYFVSIISLKILSLICQNQKPLRMSLSGGNGSTPLQTQAVEGNRQRFWRVKAACVDNTRRAYGGYQKHIWRVPLARFRESLQRFFVVPAKCFRVIRNWDAWTALVESWFGCPEELLMRENSWEVQVRFRNLK